MFLRQAVTLRGLLLITVVGQVISAPFDCKKCVVNSEQTCQLGYLVQILAHLASNHKEGVINRDFIDKLICALNDDDDESTICPETTTTVCPETTTETESTPIIMCAHTDSTTIVTETTTETESTPIIMCSHTGSTITETTTDAGEETTPKCDS